MATEEEQKSSDVPPQAAAPVHHMTLDEIGKLPDLPEDEEERVEEDEGFRPGPSFGTGM